MKLRCLEGHNSGKILDITKAGITIGREADCTLQFPEDGVSRRHSRIIMEGEKPVVIDLNSTNGVRVNGEKIAGRKVLVSGDRIGIGSHVMLITADKDVISTTTPGSVKKRVVRKPTATPVAAAAPKAGGSGLTVPIIVILLIAAAGYFVMKPGGKTPPPPSTPGTAANVPDVTPNPATPAPAPRPEPSAPDPDIQIDPTPNPSPTPKSNSGYYFVQTEPAGAAVHVDGELVGRSPIFLPQLKGGAHSLKLKLEGYEDHGRAFFVPAKDKFSAIKLQPSPGTCLITSEPNHATIMRGSQIIGVTPMLVKDLQAGDYSFRVVEYGYQASEQKIDISKFRAANAHFELRPMFGSVAITTLPAGASVFLDDTDKGKSRPGADPRGESDPIVISGLRAGQHKVEIEYNGRRSGPQRVNVAPGEAASIQLAVWVPDTFVRTISGQTIVGMLRKKNDLGDLVIQQSPRGGPVSLLNTQVSSTRQLTDAEVQQLLEKLAPTDK